MNTAMIELDAESLESVVGGLAMDDAASEPTGNIDSSGTTTTTTTKDHSTPLASADVYFQVSGNSAGSVTYYIVNGIRYIR